MPTKKKPHGRPKLDINLAQVEKLAALGCTQGDIAWVLGVSRRGLQGHLLNDPDVRDAWEKGRALGNVQLLRWQWRGAEAGNPTMLVWLGKQRLGQRDKFEHTGADGGPMKVDSMSNDELRKLLPQALAILKEAGSE